MQEREFHPIRFWCYHPVIPPMLSTCNRHHKFYESLARKKTESHYFKNWSSASCSVRLKFWTEIILWGHVAEFSNCSVLCFNFNLFFLRKSESCVAKSKIIKENYDYRMNQFTVKFRLERCIPAAVIIPSCLEVFMFSQKIWTF